MDPLFDPNLSLQPTVDNADGGMSLPVEVPPEAQQEPQQLQPLANMSVPPEALQSQPQAPEPMSVGPQPTNNPDDIVSMADESGVVRMVPFRHMEEAQLNGLKVAEPEHAQDWIGQGDVKQMLDPTTGVIHDVPKLQVDEAVQGGLIYATPAERDEYAKLNPMVTMVDPDGKVDMKKREDVPILAAQGWVKAEAEQIADEYSSIPAQAFGVIEQAVQGMSAHLYKPAVKYFAGDEALARVEMREKFAAGTGWETAGDYAEVAGSLAGAIKGVGAVGAGSQILKTGTVMAAKQTGVRALGTKVAAGTLANFVDGAAYSAVSRVGDGLTGDAPIDVENVLLGSVKDGGYAALLGAAVPVAGTLANETLGFTQRQIAQQLAGRTMPDAIDSLTDKWRYKQLAGSAKGETKRLQKALGNDADQIIGKWVNDKDIPMGAREALDAIDGHVDAAVNAQYKMVETLDSFGTALDTRNLGNTLRTQVDELLRTPHTQAEGKQFRELVKGIVQDFDKPAGTQGKIYNTMNDLWTVRKRFDDWGKFDSTRPPELAKVFQDAREVFEEEFNKLGDDILTRNAANLDPDALLNFGDVWKAAKTETRHAFMAQRVAANRLAADAGNNSISLRSVIGGSALGDAAANLIAPVLKAGAGAVMGGLAGSAVAGIGGAIALNYVAKNARGWAVKGAKATAESMRSGLLQKANETIPGVINRSLNAIDGKGQKLSTATAKTIGITSDHTATPDQVSGALQTANEVLNGGDAYDYLDQALDAVHVVHGLSFAQAMQQNIANRAQYLLDAQANSKPTPSGRTSLARTVAAMNDPIKSFTRLKAGLASDEEAKVLKTLYPAAFQNLILRLQDHPDHPAARKLERQLGITLRPSGGPEFGRWINSKPQEAQTPGGPQGKPAKGGGRSVSVSNNLAAGAQALKV
jgi:hypothetical protein